MLYFEKWDKDHDKQKSYKGCEDSIYALGYDTDALKAISAARRGRIIC